MKKPEAKREVGRLVSKLGSLTKREFKKYDEANTKKDFILPLFRALGWATEDRREVTAEDKVSRRRVDYAFRMEGIPKFFLEAKPLKADLDNPEYAWQAINYAWTKGVAWAVLTDFEGLKVFNAQWKGPSLLYNRFIDIPYTEYLKRFDELWLLSRHSFEQGLLDIEAEKVGKKAKREAVGKQLFDDLIGWRHTLYKRLKGWNDGYSAAEIDEAVQRILDRLIFIRTAEDRELEERVLLPAVREWQENGRPKELNEALVRIFRDFDKKYDSELFEVGHFCEELFCDSNTYVYVTKGLYGMRDEVPTYNFDAIDVDVLGGIYEQYLSYRQGLPEEVEEAKRRRRKKRGIYYTPKFVVQYIVENTVGRLLQERSHDEIRKLRILDPACGSGSFLIEAFDCLDSYHQEARGTAERSDKKAAQDDFLERLRILRDNIFGVDLDPQAVEIARLNLLLKTLHRRALLPKLEDNIRCGNSLISGDEEELSQYFGAEWREKRRFNWEEEFPKIMEEGGFDVVIGNPPYVRIQTLDRDEAHYYKDHYEATTGHYDLYCLFIEKSWQLLKPGGAFGLIVPNKFMLSEYGRGIRSLLSKHHAIYKVVDFGHCQIFGTGTSYTCLVFAWKQPNASVLYISAERYLEENPPRPDLTVLDATAREVPAEDLNSEPWILTGAKEAEIMKKIDQQSEPLKKVALRVFVGPQTSADAVFILEKRGESKRKVTKVFSRATDHAAQLEADLMKPLLSGKDVSRYSSPQVNRYLLTPYFIEEGRPKLISTVQLSKEFPLAWGYLKANENSLKARREPLGSRWYGFSQPKNLALQGLPKLAIPRLVDRLAVVYDAEGRFYLDNVDVGGVILREPEHRNYLYVLGLLNSRLLDWHFKRISVPFRGGFYSANRQFISPLPIRHIDFDNPQDVKMHDGLVALVERMLDLHKRLKEAKARGEEEKNLERQIARTDRQIDNLVYELYGITEEERKIIDEKTSPFRATLRNTGRKWHLSRSTLSIRPIDGVAL